MSAGVLWKCECKTKAKLEIISAYLGAWFGILAANGFKHVIYIDGFCGPGEYSNGEDGSPVIAARIATATAAKYPDFNATLIFIDSDQKALDHLQTLKAIKKQHPNVEIRIVQSEFVHQIEELALYLDRHPGSPTFSFIDPFGFGQSPLKIIAKLMHNEHSELFINFMCGFMNRFKEHENPDVTAKIKAMLDTNDLSSIIAASDHIGALCQQFEENLKLLGQFTLKFMMRDEKHIRDNAFFFCGRNSKGFEKIKGAMWKVDPEGGSSFSSHREARQEVHTQLFEPEAQTSRLSQLLLEQFRGQKNVPVKEIFRWVIEMTDVYLPQHARKELDNLFDKKKISYVDPANTGRRRRKGDWAERLVVSFAV